MNEENDLYIILNVKSDATSEEIKKSYKKLVLKYHPDKNKSEGALAHFNLLVEGFDILSNSEKRNAYDKMLESSAKNKPVILEPKKQEDYKEWKKEAKKKSETYWLTDLSDLLVLDLFLDVGLTSLFSGTESLIEGLGDSLGDVFDLF